MNRDSLTREELRARTVQAYELGRLAFAAKRIAVPALDPACVKLYEGCEIGQGIPISRAWARGWACEWSRDAIAAIEKEVKP